MSPTLAGCTILPEGLYLLEERGKTETRSVLQKSGKPKGISQQREGKHITFRIREIKFFFTTKR